MSAPHRHAAISAAQQHQQDGFLNMQTVFRLIEDDGLE
jgi:hypothetical protein